MTIFFLFYAYHQRPQYLRALGPILESKDIRRLYIQYRLRQQDTRMSVDSFRNANMWLSGEMLPWFPHQPVWNALQYCETSYRISLLLEESVFIHNSTEATLLREHRTIHEKEMKASVKVQTTKTKEDFTNILQSYLTP